MTSWFMRRWRRSALILAAPALALALLNTAGLTQSERAEDSSVGKDYEEVFAEDADGVVYINWLLPEATNDISGAAWFLGAYWSMAEDEKSPGYNKLCVDLDRSILTNNLRYAIHYSAGDASALYLNLLDTNGAAVTKENLFGDLLTSSNVIRYVAVSGEAETQAANVVLLLDVPTAKYPEAAVIRLQCGDGVITDAECRSGSEAGTSMVLEGLLYIDEDGDFITAEEERRNGSSDYFFDGGGGSISNYSDWAGGSSTNSPNGGSGGNGNGGDDDENDSGKNGNIIYVDKAIGNDTYSGRAPHVSAKKGPKKTIGGGMSIAGSNDTLVIRSGSYNENLNIKGRNIKVVIEGKVRL